MHHHQLAIRSLRDEVVGQPLQAGRQVDAEFIHPRKMVQLLHRARHIGQDDVGQPSFGKTFRAPKVLDQSAAFFRHLPGRMNRDVAIINELSGLSAAGIEANDKQRKQVKS